MSSVCPFILILCCIHPLGKCLNFHVNIYYTLTPTMDTNNHIWITLLLFLCINNLYGQKYCSSAVCECFGGEILPFTIDCSDRGIRRVPHFSPFEQFTTNILSFANNDISDIDPKSFLPELWNGLVIVDLNNNTRLNCSNIEMINLQFLNSNRTNFSIFTNCKSTLNLSTAKIIKYSSITMTTAYINSTIGPMDISTQPADSNNKPNKVVITIIVVIIVLIFISAFIYVFYICIKKRSPNKSHPIYTGEIYQNTTELIDLEL